MHLVCRSDAVKCNGIAILFRNVYGPIPELRPCPLESVVSMAKLSRFQVWKERVVFRIGSGHDHRLWPTKAKDGVCQRREPVGLKVFDDLDENGRLGFLPPLVPIGQCAMKKSHAVR